MSVSLSDLVHPNDLFFDAEDKSNGSLYLAIPSGSNRGVILDIVTRMREAGLWSEAPPKQVIEEHKNAYAEQLLLMDAPEFIVNGVRIVAIGADHPKYPSDRERWRAWKHILGTLSA